MKKKQYYLQFTTTFVETVDSLLSEYYTDLPRDAFYTFFHLMNKYSFYTKDRGSASIHSKIIRTYITKITINGERIYLAPLIIDALVEKEIITYKNHRCDKNNPELNYTRVYKFTDFFELKLDDSFIEVPITKTIANMIKKEYIRPTKKAERQQYDLLKSKRLIFDFKAASRWISARIDNLTPGQYTSLQSSISRMLNKEINVTKDSHTGRLFSNLTLMKSEFRSFITIDGEKLVGIDLKSAQPYILSSRLLSLYPDNDQVKEFYTLLTEEDIYTHFRNRWIELNGSANYTVNSIDDETFEPITEIVEIADRKAAKLEFMRLMYKKTKGSVPFQVVLKNDFPEVYGYLVEMKKKYSKGIGNNLAVYLQKEESKIFLPVAEKFKNCLSCHDGLYVKESEAKEVYAALSNNFKALGYNKYKLTLE